MSENPDPEHLSCLNCGTSVTGDYCSACGQHVRDNTNRSIKGLLGVFLENTFFLDNRFLKSLRYLFAFPGRMTVEFVAGKRKKFVSPVTLFLFVNLIYFIVNPLSDYSLSLGDQFYSQPYSELIQEVVRDKLRSTGLDGKAYGEIYQKTSDNISKSIMIINVPLIALLVYLMSFKRRKFYYDSLIFAFHFFSVYLFSWICLDWMGALVSHLPDAIYSVTSDVSFALFVILIPVVYGVLSIKRFLNLSWGWAIPAGIGVFLAVNAANMVYRFIILFLTLWCT